MHRHWAPSNGENHVLQAVFDALADLNFILTRKKLYGSHLTHVNTHGIGRTAEFTFYRRKRSFGFRFGIFIAYPFSTALNEQLLLIGSHFVHRNVEIAKNVDNRLDGIFVKQRVGDVVIDFAVGDVAALLAQADQLDEFGAAVFRRLFSRPVAMLHGLHERLVTRSARLLGAARLFWRRLRLSLRRRRLYIRSAVFVSLFTDIFNRLDVFDLIEFGDVFIVGILIINNACDVFAAVVIKIKVFAVSVDRLCRFFASFALRGALGRLRFGRFRFGRLDWRRLSLLC